MRPKYPPPGKQYEDPLAEKDPFDLRQWRPATVPEGTAPMGSLGPVPKMADGGEIDGDPYGGLISHPDPSLDPNSTASGYGIDLSQAPARVSGTSDLSAVPPLEYTRKAAEAGEKLAGMSSRPSVGRTVGAVAANWFLGRHGNPAGKMASDAILNSDPNTLAYNEQKRKYEIDSELAQQERQGQQTTALAGYHTEQAETRAEVARSNELHQRDQERQQEEKIREQKSKDAAVQADAEAKAETEYDKMGYGPAQTAPYQLPPSVDLGPVAPPPGEMPQPKQPPMFTPGQTRGTVEDIPEGAVTRKNRVTGQTMVQRRIPTPPAIKAAFPQIGDTMPEEDLPKYTGLVNADTKQNAPEKDTATSLAVRAAAGDKQAAAALKLIKPPPAATINNFTPDAIEYAARQYKETGIMPPLGMGASPARALIMNRAAELAKAEGATPQDVVGGRASYKADAASLTALQRSRDAVTAFENTAGKNLDLFLKQAKTVMDSGSPWINKPLRSIDAGMLGDKDVPAFNAARQVAINEIAKVTSNPGLSGQLSDSARREVEAFIPANATLAQAYSVAKVLRQDMANRRNSYDDALKEIKGRIGGSGKGAGANGQISVTDPNGGVHVFPDQASADNFKRAARIK